MNKFNPFLNSSCLLVLGACGGGGGSNDNVTTGLQVSQTTPADGATDVARDVAVTARFNKDVLSTSVSAGTVMPEGNGQSVQDIVSFDGVTNTATILADADFNLLTEYTATVTSGITDLSGNALASDQNWTFQVRDGQWRTPGLIENVDVDDAFSPRMAVDAQGRALALWQQSDGALLNIWANRYEVGTGWLGAESIELNAGQASSPIVTTDGQGNVLAVRSNVNAGETSYIWSNRYEAGVGWGNAVEIEFDTGPITAPHIAMDPSGNAIAVWSRPDIGAGTSHIWWNRYGVNTGWSSAELFQSVDADPAFSTQVAIDAMSNAMMVWAQSNGLVDNIGAGRFN